MSLDLYQRLHDYYIGQMNNECHTQIQIPKTPQVHFTCQDHNIKTVLRTKVVYIFAIRLIMFLVATNDFNYSYFLSFFIGALKYQLASAVEWKSPPPPLLQRPFRLLIFILPPLSTTTWTEGNSSTTPLLRI